MLLSNVDGQGVQLPKGTSEDNQVTNSLERLKSSTNHQNNSKTKMGNLKTVHIQA
jgi:hypothetical protein